MTLHGIELPAACWAAARKRGTMLSTVGLAVAAALSAGALEGAFLQYAPSSQVAGMRTPRTSSTVAAGPQGRSLSSSACRSWHAAAMAALAAFGSRGLATQRRSNLRERAMCKVVQKATGEQVSDGKKTVIITGASSGLGLAAAIELAKTGEWHIIMACRDYSKTEIAARKAEIPEDCYTIVHLDLASINSVKDFVRNFRSLGRPLDVLVCNAAVYFPNADKKGAILPGLFEGGGARYSADGYELSFAANYLGHFLLCNLLLEDLQKSSVKPARCVILGTVTASVNDKDVGGMIPPLADVGEFQGLEKGFKAPITMVNGEPFVGAKAYKDSKVCCVMLMRELHKRFHKSTGIVFSSLYPGCITDTGLFREHYPAFRLFWPLLMKKVVKSYVSNEEAGQRLAKVVSHPEYSVSGSYYSWGGAAGTGGSGGTDAADNTEVTKDILGKEGSFRTLDVDDIKGKIGDDAYCSKLFDLSKKLVGMS